MSIITGTENDDKLWDTASMDDIRGLGGNDTIELWYGSDGALDIASGDDGNDVVRVYAGRSLLVGGDGADSLYGGELEDVMTANKFLLFDVDSADYWEGEWWDVLDGRAGNDRIIVSEGLDRVDAGAGDDEIEVHLAAAPDLETLPLWIPTQVNGGAGIDTLILAILPSSWRGISYDLLTTVSTVSVSVQQCEILDFAGTTGADSAGGMDYGDTFSMGAGDDTVEGRGGGDAIDGATGEDSLDGGSGNDTVMVEVSAGDRLTGGLGFDKLILTRAAEIAAWQFDGKTGNGSGGFKATAFESFNIVGSQGKDSIGGGNNSDTIDGGGGADQLQGGSGEDTISGKTGNDVILAGAGNDTVSGDSGNDTIDLAQGEDIAESGTEDDKVSVYASLGDRLTDADGFDTLVVIRAAGGSDWSYQFYNNYSSDGFSAAGFEVLRFTGGAAAENVTGGQLGDLLNGMAGADALLGAQGADTLNGGAGDDYLESGVGIDRLTGGAGNDTFFFNGISEKGDSVGDFDPSNGGTVDSDHVGISASGFGGGLVAYANLAAARFIANAAPVAAMAGRGTFLYDTDDGRLLWDGDGAGGAAAQILVTLTGAPPLTVQDFVIYG
ncbi:MAG: calcium-binding protein [Methylococcaceae bacterium]|nr:MAG: calcium-binding protein [Methylococcaceae bacterium]